MIARFVTTVKNYRQRATYTVVTICLVTLLKLGHATHWTFAAGHDSALPAASPAAPRNAQHGDAAPARKSDEIRIAGDVLAAAGIRVEDAATHSIRHTLVVNGVTGYDQDRVAQLAVRTPGHIWRVEKKVGQEIRQGDCLAIIDAVEVGEAKTEFLQAVVNLELKEKTLARLRRVAAEVAERSLRVAEAEHREAQLRMLSAQQKLINLGLPLKAEELRGDDDAELAGRLRTLGLPPSVVALLDPETATANLIPLTAPFDGIVIGRAATVGEIVSPSSTTFVVADIERMWITLDVRKEHAGLVRLGQEVTFQADGAAAPVGGRIDWISTELDETTRTLGVRASVANPKLVDKSSGEGRRLLTANTFGVGRIVLREVPQAVAVPTPAVQFDGAKHFVFVRTEAGFVRRDVVLGSAEDGRTEIVAGLAAGEKIAVAGSHVLKAEMISLAQQ